MLLEDMNKILCDLRHLSFADGLIGETVASRPYTCY